MFTQTNHHFFDGLRKKSKEHPQCPNYGELKNIYDNIVRFNAESPLYMVELSDDLQDFAIQVKEHARELKSSIDTIVSSSSKNNGKLFHKKLLTSSHPNIAGVKFIGANYNFDSFSDCSLDIHNLAAPQINRGNRLRPDSHQLPPQLYSFRINIGKYDYEFEFQVKEKECNLDIQKKVAKLLNRSDIGIYASLEAVPNSNRHFLQLQSNNTGSINGTIIFSVTDGSHQSALSILGIDQIDQHPTNASFTLNNIEKSSFSNTFTVNKLYEISIYQTTTHCSPVWIGLSNDMNAIYEHISKLFAQYNTLLKLSFSPASSDLKTTKLHTHLNYIAQCYNKELKTLGIFQDEHHILHIHSDQLHSKIKQEEKGDGLYPELQTFLRTLSERLDAILLNPMDYVDKKVVTYPDTEKKAFPSSYITSMYSGLLFNDYC